MPLINNSYFQNVDEPLAQILDKAWADYQDLQKSDNERLEAQEFLVHVLDIDSTKDINKQLIERMLDRIKHKDTNPEYIPGLRPRHLRLEPQYRPKAGPYAEPFTTNRPKVLNLITHKELLDVDEVYKAIENRVYKPANIAQNERAKFLLQSVDGKLQKIPVNSKPKENTINPRDNKTPFFDEKERASFRIYIHNGLFYKQGTLFDTSSYSSHLKSGFAAYTLNANGELSVFTHPSIRGKINHSSLNNQAPLVGAGELIIENGCLIGIDTHSGHYKPSLYTIYRILQYFVDKKIDISKTMVYTENDPNSRGLTISSQEYYLKQGTEAYGYKDEQTRFGFRADELVRTLKDELLNAVNTIQKDIEEYRSISLMNIVYYIKDYLTSSGLTAARHTLAKELLELTADWGNMLGGYVNENKEIIKTFIGKLTILKEQNESLSQKHGKDIKNGRLQGQINTFLETLENLNKLDDFPAGEMAQMHDIW